MIFEKNDRVIFFGDSITDSNRRYDMLPAHWASWGEGYVNLLNAYTTALCPQEELMIVNLGVSGDTVVELNKRTQDVLDLRADWVTIMIGVNDVWRHFDGTYCQDPLVDLATFESEYRQVLAKLQPHVKGIIILGAFMVEKNLDDPMRKMLAGYQQVAKKLAEEFSCPYGNPQKEIDRFLEHQSSYVLSSDRVHPSLAGHLLIAKTWLETVGILGGDE